MKKWAILCFLLVSPIIQAQTWNKDLHEAEKLAASEGKLVLLLFSVPDECDRCLQLEKNVFGSPEFLAYAKDKFILAKPDFSAAASFETKADNLLIVEKYNKDGFFPLVVILDKSRVLGAVGIYNGETPGQYVQSLKSIAGK
ncbi:MAG: thioredoxin family protein [Flavobacterium sp.]|nr:MAG: thioredoxin family protein [Flavobacterium sp.]